jgi:hypothetical protein
MVDAVTLAAGVAIVFLLLMVVAAAEMKKRQGHLERRMNETAELLSRGNLAEARAHYEMTVMQEYLRRFGGSGKIPESFEREMGEYARQIGLLEKLSKANELPRGIRPETYVQEAVHNMMKNPWMKRLSPDLRESIWAEALSTEGDEKKLEKVLGHYLRGVADKQAITNFADELSSYMTGKWGQHERTETPAKRAERLKREKRTSAET